MFRNVTLTDNSLPQPLQISQCIVLLMRLGQSFDYTSLEQVVKTMVKLKVVKLAVFAIFCCCSSLFRNY
jgi:hypothetical protein